MMELNWLYLEFKTICLALISGFLLYLWMSERTSKLPPGPIGLPFVGYIPFLGRNIALSFTKLSKKYGPVFSVNMGRATYVVINRFDILHEALVKNSDVFSGRTVHPLLELLGKRPGLPGTDYGPRSKAYKKLILSVLKRFGMGKRTMECKILEELPCFCNVIESKGGEAFNVTSVMSSAVSNIITSIVIGKRLDYEDERFKRLVFLINRRFGGKLDAQLTTLLKMELRLRYLPIFKGVFERTLEQMNYTTSFLDEFVAEHKLTLDPSDIRDMIDAYLLEMKTNDEDFTLDGIGTFMLGIFNAGTETTATTLIWCFLYLAGNPHFQAELHEKIYSVFGDSGLPVMEKQLETPLVCSFLLEIQRHRTIVQAALHKTTGDTKLLGYFIPKNTPIFPNVWAIHHNPKTFEEPDVFKPDRFLDEKGEFVKHPNVIPFLIGPRSCVASKMAEMEAYIFLTGIMQKFKIVPENGINSLPSFDESNNGLVSTSLPFKIRFMRR